MTDLQMAGLLCECDDGSGLCRKPATQNSPDYDGEDFPVCDEHAAYSEGVRRWIETGYDPVLEAQAEVAAALTVSRWIGELRG